ncbi:sensor histidine kinase [Actinomadura rudentiformis]|uniref:histidine kinase n=1 Tax=Actinomadura rudentiformis TaxID=359158 RepID=A0A6H9YPP3_9ACTN|nr:HAMP domain-containing sensor histidine kinase [Actinomadura rudentiformis]KAB2348327.1 HAMP domain-containing histidine kinase [Actinomadura rudentiformis]
MTLTAGAIAALVCGGVSMLVLLGVRGQVEDFEREKTISAALEVVHLIKRDRLPAVLPRGETAGLQVLNAKDQVVSLSANLKGHPPIASFKPSEQSVYTIRMLCPPAGLKGCMQVVAFRVYQPDGDWTIYAAGDVIPWYVSSNLVVFLLCLSVLLVLITVVGCWRTVDQTLAPVDAIRAKLAEITATESGRRVPVPPNQDELRALAEAANATLDRLDAAIEQQRRFTSDASHDLRSPITAARAQVEDALLHPDDTDWPEVGRAVLTSLDRLQDIVSDLLELARLDAGAAREGSDLVDLADLVDAEVSRSPRTKEIVTELEPGVTVRGDRLCLARLLTNLLDNAERHATSTMQVVVGVDGDSAILEVTDDGAGIAAGDREIVFQRFTRLDAARSRDAGGTGLGLPIARQVALAHNGTLRIEDSARGARFVLRIPRSD